MWSEEFETMHRDWQKKILIGTFDVKIGNATLQSDQRFDMNILYDTGYVTIINC